MFQARAEKDLAAYRAHLEAVIGEGLKRSDVSAWLAEASAFFEVDDIVKHFVQNCRGLRVLRVRSLAQEYDAKSASSGALNSMLEDHEEDVHFKGKTSTVHFYTALRAAHAFASRNKGRYPGQPSTQSPEETKKDAQELVKIQVGGRKRGKVQRPRRITRFFPLLLLLGFPNPKCPQTPHGLLCGL